MLTGDDGPVYIGHAVGPHLCLRVRGGLVSTTHIRDEARVRGQIGPKALEMMLRVFSSLVLKFPEVRHQEPIADLVNSFFEDKGRAYVVAILAATDDAAAERITYSWGTNWLVDEARKLPFGALRNRLEKRLSRSDLFSPSVVAHNWYLEQEQDEDRPHDPADLAVIAARADIEVVRTSDGGMRLGKSGELEELLRQLLHRAGRLHVAELTVICGRRFPAVLQARDASVTTADIDWEIIEDAKEATSSVFLTAEKARAERAAASLLPLLSAEDVAVIRFRDDIARLSEELNCSRSSAYNARGRLRGRLEELAGDGPDARHMMAALVRLVLDESQTVPSVPSDRENPRAI